MRHLNRILCSITLMLATMNAVSAATADAIYQGQCASCHGATGAGDGPQAGQNGIAAPKAFTTAVPDRMTVEKAMMEGVNGIPGHGMAPLLVGDELQNLIDYVYRLAQPPKAP